MPFDYTSQFYFELSEKDNYFLPIMNFFALIANLFPRQPQQPRRRNTSGFSIDDLLASDGANDGIQQGEGQGSARTRQYDSPARKRTRILIDDQLPSTSAAVYARPLAPPIANNDEAEDGEVGE
jgi:hypothetical protein